MGDRVTGNIVSVRLDLLIGIHDEFLEEEVALERHGIAPFDLGFRVDVFSFVFRRG